MEYLLKASAVIVVFFICYKVFLQRETFFGQNRWFLLGGLLVSFLIPLVIIPIYIEYTPVAIPNYNFGEVVVEHTEKPFDILEYLPMVYLLGVVFFSVRFLIQLASLSMVVFKNKSVEKGRYTYVETKTDISPFSFFNRIVYNPNQFNKTELEQIIAHEKIHANQWHSVDILLTQLACVALWFNPFIWFYNNMVKQNLEFIADKVTQNKFDTKSYQTTLLKTSMPSHQMALSNNFYNSLIKKRIVMLHKSKSKKINLIKYAFVIPLLAAFLMSFNTEAIYVEKVLEKEISNNAEQTLETQKTTQSDTLKIIFDKDLSDNDLRKIKNNLKKDTITFTYSELKRNDKGEIINIATKFESNGGHCTLNATHEPIEPFYFYKSKTVFGVGAVKKEGVSNDDPKADIRENPPKHIKPFSVSITKNFTNEDFKDAIKKGKEKGVTLKFSKIKRNSLNEIIGIYAEFKTENGSGISKRNGIEPIKSFAYYQSNEGIGFGKAMSNVEIIGYGNAIFKEGNKIISSDSILFNKRNIATDTLYFDQAVQKNTPRLKISNGKIAIITKNHSDAELNTIKEQLAKHAITVLFSDIKRNDKNEIIKLTAKVSNNKGSGSATWENGENPIPNIELGEKENGRVVSRTIQVTTKDNFASKNQDMSSALYIVDGKEIKKEDVDKISPDKIESITVLKGESAIKEYGKKGKDGVVKIKMKK